MLRSSSWELIYFGALLLISPHFRGLQGSPWEEPKSSWLKICAHTFCTHHFNEISTFLSQISSLSCPSTAPRMSAVPRDGPGPSGISVKYSALKFCGAENTLGHEHLFGPIACELVGLGQSGTTYEYDLCRSEFPFSTLLCFSNVSLWSRSGTAPLS